MNQILPTAAISQSERDHCESFDAPNLSQMAILPATDDNLRGINASFLIPLGDEELADMRRNGQRLTVEHWKRRITGFG